MNSKKKQTQAFQAYLLENKDAHYRFIYSYTRHAEDAMDVIQDSIVKALKAFEKQQFPESLNSWFYKIMVNTALDYLRKNKKIVIYDPDDFEKILESEDTYMNFDLQSAIETLPTELKMIIMLRYFEDFKISDIAQILQQNENTIKTRLYRGLKLLKIELQEEV